MKRFADLTRSAQKQRLGGMRGDLATVWMRGMGGEIHTVEIEGLATLEDEIFEGVLVARDYYSSDMRCLRLANIRDLQPKGRPITDPQHPDYEDPGRKVEPAPRRA